MLSNFIRRSGRRKGDKVNGARFHQKSHSVSSPLASSLVFNISEAAAQGSRSVEVDSSGFSEEWFPQELLRGRSRSPGPIHSPSRSQNAEGTRNNPTQRTHADSSVLENVSLDAVSRKKLIPAPISIPDADLMLPIHVGNLAVPSARPPVETFQPSTNHDSLEPPSPSTSDNISVISGTTLPHGLMGASFVLSPTERHNSHGSGGVVRQDSATLPRSEHNFLPDSQKPSSIPPVPQYPQLVPSKPNCPFPVRSSASTEPEHLIPDRCITSPEVVARSVFPQRASPAQGIPSSVVSSSTVAYPFVISAARKVNPGSARKRIAESGMSGCPRAVAEVSFLTFPAGSQGSTQHSPQEGSGHGPDEFDFVPPEPYTASNVGLLAKRSGPNRGQRKCRGGGSNPVRHRSNDNSIANDPSAPLQSRGIPSATTSEQDYSDLLDCDLTVSSQSSTSVGYQTFPETPRFFSPLQSPESARPDNQTLRRRPPSVKYTGLRSAQLYASMRAARRQLVKKDGAGGPVVPRRSQSSWLSARQTPSPKQAGSKSLPPTQVNDEAGIDKSDRRLAMNMADRPHPFASISLPEERAPPAIASYLTSFLPYLAMHDVDASVSSVTVPASAIDSSLKSPTSVALPELTSESPLNSPTLADSQMVSLPPTSPLRSSIPVASATVSPPPPSNSPFSAPTSFHEEPSLLYSPSPPASLSEPCSELVSQKSTVSPPAASLDGSLPPSPPFVPPPPYHTIVSERITDHPGSVFMPSLSRKSSIEQCYQCTRQAYNSSTTPGSVQSRVRVRPPLPIGPRKQNGRGQILGPPLPGVRSRGGSTPSVVSGGPVGGSGSLWRKLRSAVSKSPPKFQPPPPKWRGLTLEAAQWTFTSAQLQEMVSRAIQQASEGSTLRFLRLEILDGEVADELHHLELQHTDVKAQYRALVRKRWTLLGSLTGHLGGVETSDVVTVSRTMEELTEVLLALDRLADKMHDIVLRMAQLKSLRDVHNASALAMAVRKINGLFVRQMAEKERLQEQVDTLQTERDEAWKHAEDIAQDYDTLTDRVSETASASADIGVHGEIQPIVGSRRSTRISAVRKSSIRLSQAGLRSRCKHRPARSSSSATRPTSLTSENIPPVPRLLVKPLSLRSTTFSSPTGKSAGSMYSNPSPRSDALALAEAQREVYEMLGLSLPPSPASSRRRTLSNPDQDPKPPPLSSRHMSDSLTESRARQWVQSGGWDRGVSSLSWTM